MKREFLAICYCFIIIIFSVGVCNAQDVTINWTMSNIESQEVQEFQLFLNYSTDKANRVQLQNCSMPTETDGAWSSTCSNVNIEHYPVYFTVEAVIPETDNIESPDWESKPPTTVQDFKLAAVNPNTSPVAELSATPTAGTAPLPVNFDGSGSHDPDGTIVSYNWNFGDGSSITTTGATTSHTFSEPGNYPVTLTVTDNQGNSSETASVQILGTETSPDTFYLAVNFQQGDNAVPTGFVRDHGYPFEHTQSPGYGWIGTLPTDARDRNNPLSPDQSYDTFIWCYPNYIWEAELPSGTYNVSVCVGDVSYPGYSIQSLSIEGVSVLDPEATTGDNRWITKNINVTINDGRITLTFIGADQFTALCWIKIESL